MSRRVTARRRSEIRKRQKERKRTNDARKAEAKLLASVDTQPVGSPVWWGATGVSVSPDGTAGTEWKDQSGNGLDLSKSK